MTKEYSDKCLMTFQLNKSLRTAFRGACDVRGVSMSEMLRGFMEGVLELPRVVAPLPSAAPQVPSHAAFVDDEF